MNEEATVLETEPIPSTRALIASHINHASVMLGDAALIHLAVAAGIGLAMATIEEIDLGHYPELPITGLEEIDRLVDDPAIR